MDEWPLAQGVLVKPALPCFGSAIRRKAHEYRRLDRDLELMRGCLAQGLAFVLGFSVYESIQGAEHAGTIDLPGRRETLLGGHAVVAVGYDDEAERFIIRNSWGTWGAGGYGTLPYAYLESPNLSDDFWTLSSVTVP